MSDMVGRVLMRKRRMLTGFVVGRVQLRKGERLSSGRSGVDRSRDGRLEEGPWKYGLERVEFGISLVSSHGLESSRCRARPSALANFGAPRHRSSLAHCCCLHHMHASIQVPVLMRKRKEPVTCS